MLVYIIDEHNTDAGGYTINDNIAHFSASTTNE